MKKLLLFALFAGGLSITTTQTIVCDTNKASTKVVKLYVYKNCPYCHKVINYLKKHGVADKVLIISADNVQGYAELQKLSQSTQCPFMYDEINNVKMLESSEIIKYFTKLFDL